jgi:hypothetical protein
LCSNGGKEQQPLQIPALNMVQQQAAHHQQQQSQLPQLVVPSSAVPLQQQQVHSCLLYLIDQ